MSVLVIIFVVFVVSVVWSVSSNVCDVKYNVLIICFVVIFGDKWDKMCLSFSYVKYLIKFLNVISV